VVDGQSEMSIKNLDSFFKPRSIAVIGADENPISLGYFIFRNLIGKGFKGVVYPVNPQFEAVQGVESYKSIIYIRQPIDLAILSVPIDSLLKRLEECGQKDVKGVLILAPDFEKKVKDYKVLEDRVRQLSLFYGFRVMGPNSLGFLRPGLSLNASLFPKMPQKGNIAFISQSATLSSALLDRAISKNVGFSYFICLGTFKSRETMIDISVPDLIDFLGIDPETRAIVLYIQHIEDGRNFMTAVRSFANSKPIIVAKSGRFDLSAQTAYTRLGSLAGGDKVYDAAIERAGAVRVDEVLDFFYTTETLSKQGRPKGKRLAIITNAGGPSMIAVDALLKMDGVLANLSEDTIESLTKQIPEVYQVHNPIHLLTNSSPSEYEMAVKTCLKDPGVDGILVMHVPFFGAKPMQTAEAVVSAARTNPYIPIFTTWMGEEQVTASREFLNTKGISTFYTPEQAVRSFIYTYRYDYNLKLLRETPELILKDFVPDISRARDIVKNAFDEGRMVLFMDEVKVILETYGIPVIETVTVESEEEAAELCDTIGCPVVMRIDSCKILHQLKKGRVRLNLKDRESVREAYSKLKKIISSLGHQEARIVIQPMMTNLGYELAIGAKKDPTFGSAILFGTGGALLEALGDYSVELPPLNQTLARHLMNGTRIYRYLKTQPAFKKGMRFLEEILVRFSQLIVDFPSIKEIDINPFFIMSKEGVVLDACILLDEEILAGEKGFKEEICPPHLSICPYPFKYVRETTLEDGTPIVIRPIRPEDEPLIYELYTTLKEETVIFRFGQRLVDMPHERLGRYCQIDYDRELAFVAEVKQGECETIIGDVRIIKLPDLEVAEVGILVTDQWQNKGVGTLLLKDCIEAAMDSGVKVLWMEIVRDNYNMHAFAKKFGFWQTYADEHMVKMVLKL
jgi:acetyltransferase